VPSDLLNLLYSGQRDEAEALAPKDVFDAAAIGDAGKVAAFLRDDPAGATAWSDDGFTALHYACFFGTPDAAAALVEAGADVEVPSRNDMGVRPMNAAAAGRHAVETIRLLLAAGADVDGTQTSGHTALDEARIREDQAMIELLTKAGARG
jgi:ankyrin repeat protein